MSSVVANLGRGECDANFVRTTLSRRRGGQEPQIKRISFAADKCLPMFWLTYLTSLIGLLAVKGVCIYLRWTQN
jgi:hypothetical protein